MAEAHAFPPDSPAPWAEIVPGVGPMTVHDLLALPDDGWQYELVQGRLIRMLPEGFEASNIAARLLIRLGAYIEDHDLGEVTGEAGGYDLSPAGRNDTALAPDIAFVSADRLPPHVSFDVQKAVPFAPNLAVEVASPNQYRPGMAAKAQRYLTAGTRLVWVLWPGRRQVDVWHPEDTQPTATLGVNDTLDGEDVVLGFTYPVARLFR